MPIADLQRTYLALTQGITQKLHLGAQLALRHGERRLSGAVGLAAPDTPLTPAHIMPWRSAGKPITAVAILLLWQQYQLDIDDPVASHLPEFAANGKQDITLRHLLTHTAGLRRMIPFDAAPIDQVVQRICQAPLERNWPPGRKAGYDIDSAWLILGAVIERLTGKALGQFVKEEILDPLQMSDCHLCLDGDQARSLGPRVVRLALTQVDPPVLNEADDVERLGICRPGSTWRGPARELLKFWEMLLDRGRDILLPMTVDAMTARQRCGLFDQSFQHVIDWGLGVLVNSAQHGIDTVPYGYGSSASPRTFGHAGRQMACALVDPENNLACVILWNGAPGEKAHDQRLRATLNALYTDLGISA